MIKNNQKGFIGTSVELPNNHLKSFVNKTINFICDEYKKMSIDEYPVATPKDYIEKISCNNPIICKAVKSLRHAINDEETNNNNPADYKSAYVITIDIDDTTIIFITKKKLINTYKNKHLYARLNGEKYEHLTNDLIQLVMHFDCIIMNDTCYITTLQGRKFFHLEDISKKQSIETITDLLSMHIIADTDKEIITEYISKPKNYSLLANPDAKIIKELSNVNKNNRKKLEKKYKLSFVENNGIWSADLSSPEKIRDFADTITHKRALNFDLEVVSLRSPYKTSP